MKPPLKHRARMLWWDLSRFLKQAFCRLHEPKECRASFHNVAAVFCSKCGKNMPWSSLTEGARQ